MESESDDRTIVGVSLAFLYEFIEMYDIAPDMTTQQVVTDVIIPNTIETKESYIDAKLKDKPEYLFNFENERQSNEVQDDPMGYSNKTSAIYLIHAWQTPFQTLVDIAFNRVRVEETAMCYIPSKEELQDIKFFWIDIFCKNQHDESDIESFHKAMSLSDGVYIALWPSEPVVFERLWCLFEIWTALSMRKHVGPSWTEECADEAYPNRYNWVVAVESATTTEPQDREAIMTLIENSIGVDEMNQQLSNYIRSDLNQQTAARDPTPACFSGDGLVSMPFGEKKQVKRIRPGDQVLTHCGKFAAVNLVTEDIIQDGWLEMCNINGLLLTPDHPVLCGDGTWRSPEKLVPKQTCKMDKVFNFELEKGYSSVIINGVAVVTLGSELSIRVDSDALYGWGWWHNPLRFEYIARQKT